MDFLIRFLASYLIWILFAGLFILWVVDGKIKKEQVVHALFSCILAWAISFLIKQAFPTVRPFWLDGEAVKTLTIPQDAAFPSIHTAVGFALSVTIFMHDKKYGWLFLIASFLIGISRIMANVHYPADIFAGAFLGTLVAVVVEKVHLFGLITKIRKIGG